MKTFTIIDRINVRSSRAIKDLDYNENGEYSITAVAIDTEEKEINGEPSKISYFKADDGTYFCTISAAVYEQVSEIIEVISSVEDGDFPDMKITFLRRKSNAGKIFYQIRID